MASTRRLDLLTGHTWTALVDELACLLPSVLSSPYATARIVVATPATGRVLSQHLASRLSISAGISMPTLGRLEHELAQRGGVARERSRWLGTPLELAVLSAMEESPSPLVRRALSSARPGHRRAAASRIARVFRHYSQVSPGLVGAWLDGSDDGPDGALSEEAAWQPAVLRRAVDLLEVDPGDLTQAYCAEARTDSTPTFLVGIDEVSADQRAWLDAFAHGAGLTALALPGAADWAETLATSRRALPGTPPPPTQVSVHDSHGPARQVEVLRDELVREFADDPTLEPRDVLIVCPNPERYAHLLDAAFLDPSHPGSGLRLQPMTSTHTTNPVLSLLARVLLLADSRVTASTLVDLLLCPAISHRWGFRDGPDLRELVTAAGIRWGLDAAQRARFNLPGLTQNTWLRGIDRLLLGLSSGENDAGVGLTGAGAVSASDMATVGALAEVLSRLRRITSSARTGTTVEGWTAIARGALTDIVGLPSDDEWQTMHAHAVLSQLARDHAGDDVRLTRHEFARLLSIEQTQPAPRVFAGNGSLQVVDLGELPHVQHRLVAMIGLTDDVLPGPAALPDAIDLPEAPDLRQRRMTALLNNARSAPRLIIVRQGFSTHTGRAEAGPVCVDWLTGRLGATPPHTPHAAVATAASSFRGDAPSFDTAALGGVLARSHRPPTQASPATRRREDARTQPLPTPAQHDVTLAQLTRFLEDPARAFLRSRGGITRYQETILADEIPIRVDSLTRWRVTEDVLTALREGRSIDEVQERIRRSEQLPPQQLGKDGFDAAVEDAQRLWRHSAAAREQPPLMHRLDVPVDLGEFGHARLLDDVAIHGSSAVTLTASSSNTKLIRPWLECLALAAAEHPATATLFRYAPWPDKGRIDAVEFTAPDEAMPILTALLRAYALGHARLLPIPAEPGIAFARQWCHTGVDTASWQGPLGHWRSHWPRLGQNWPLFYDDDLAELVSDLRIETDPHNGQSRAFPAWALELYAPLVRSMS